jgi:adenine C2-methylase RlmN of 23S rRNA A2503 and tRNA A37
LPRWQLSAPGPFRARQLWPWIYHRGATDFALMTSLSKKFRERLWRKGKAGP